MTNSTKKCPKLTKLDSEANFQKKVKKWLKEQGCEVWIISPGGGIPDSAEDVLFFKEGFYGFLECKKSKNAKHRPGQDKMVEKHNQMSYSRFCYPENWKEIQDELGEMLK